MRSAINFLFFLDDCRKIEFTEQMSNRALKNYVIKRYEGIDEEMCEIYCYLEPNCRSYNYGLVNNEIFLCELNNKHHLQALSNELEAKDEFKYRPIAMVSNMLQSIL